MNLERKRADGVQGLPSGWKREEVVRRKGLSAGKIDVVYCRYGNMRLLVKCGMRKVKCGIQKCGMVGKTRKGQSAR